MNRRLLTVLASLVLGLFAVTAVSAEVVSLRGDNGLNKEAIEFDKKRVETKDGGFHRSWKLQPPSIPHKIDRERINLQENSCLRCHSKENYEKEKAKKIGDSHYVDANGKKLDQISMRRYFCTQCHTTQVQANPLVQNTFVGDNK